MNIRPAVAADRPAIIELLKSSLGESTIPKSEKLWRWKHEENPFGSSYVLLAEENNRLIGLRAFMKWEWIREDKIYRAIRAVDTATHPDHQGKGIFKKLTLAQLDICKKEGVDFVFNTPNEKSLPGYLKMGWVKQGKMPLKIKMLRPFSLAFKLLLRKKKVDLISDPSPTQNWDGALTLLNNISTQKNAITTKISQEYISWRYANNPLFRYNYFTDNKSYIAISRIKSQSISRELRIVDFILLDATSNAKQVSRDIRKNISAFCRKNKIEFISVSGRQYMLNKKFFGWMGILPVKPLGPVITFRDINLNERFADLLPVNNWNYRLGDFELF